MSKKVLGNKKKGQLFVISAPAGTGKSTLVEMLIEEFPEVVVESCSCTTRSPRPGEIAQRHYIFLSEIEFEERIQNDDFLEYASVFGNRYGTPRSEVYAQLENGKHVILVIDTQGALQIKGKIPATFIFISPPSMEELKKRLLKRKTEDDEKIKVRLEWAKHEIELASHYDYQLINDDLHITYQILRSILIAEEHKNKNRENPYVS